MRLSFLSFLFFISLFVFSYSSPVEIEIESYPPIKFSFMDIDPNSVSVDEYERRMEYEWVIKGINCSVPMYVMNQYDLPVEVIKTLFVDENYMKVRGLYWFSKNITIKNWPKEFIFIEKDYSPEQMLATFFHEYSHYLHRKYGCICFKVDGRALLEAHAIHNALRLGIEYDLPKVVKKIYINTCLYILEEDISPEYKLAAIIVASGDLFAKAKHYLEEKEENFTIISYEDILNRENAHVQLSKRDSDR